jgi:hypothetical protein
VADQPAFESLDEVRPLVNILLPRVLLQELHDRLAYRLGPLEETRHRTHVDFSTTCTKRLTSENGPRDVILLTWGLQSP